VRDDECFVDDVDPIGDRFEDVEPPLDGVFGGAPGGLFGPSQALGPQGERDRAGETSRRDDRQRDQHALRQTETAR